MFALFLFAFGCDEDGGSSVTGSEEVDALVNGRKTKNITLD